MTIRAVLDTRVLVPATVRIELRNLAQAGAFTAIWSPWIIAELNRVLTWQWIDHTGHDLSQHNRNRCSEKAQIMMATLLATPFELANPLPPYPLAWETLNDQWDYPIWATAVESKAQYVISANIHDYPPETADGRHVYNGIEYISAERFISMLVEA